MTSLLDAQVVRQRASESAPLVRAYALVMAARGAWARLRGDRLGALESLLRARRAVGGAFAGSAALEAMVRGACRHEGRLLPAARNELRLEWLRSPEAAAIRRAFAAFPASERVRLRFPGDNDPERQGDLIVLKPFDPATGEKGVLLVKYTEAIRRFAAMLDLGALAPRYAVVLEPSSWGYQDLAFLLYLGADLDVVVQAPWKPDHDWIAGLGANLVPVRQGAGDWVDPRQFAPLGRAERAYDLVMVSSWSPVKRHEELFRTLAALRRRGRRLRVALVGYPSQWTR
ncbi:MAG TPA: hypothetical protein VF541_08760, partial [Longimicrobium sp.]